MRRLTIEDLQKTALAHGGLCLSKEYENAHKPIFWECSLGHQWISSASNVRSGGWCHECGYKRSASAKKYVIGEMRDIAESRGGKCLSLDYVDAHTHLEWECSLGHIWRAIPSSIIRGSWCSECSPFLSERICRGYFEAIFGNKFPKVRPEWMKTYAKGRLELDGYCEKLGIAFEHQGMQHYLKSKQFLNDDKQLKSIQKRDAIKKKLCKENSILLIEIPAINYYTPLAELESLIFHKLSKYGINPVVNRPISIDWGRVYCPENINSFNKLKEFAALRGGKLLSTEYSGVHGKYEFQCEKGHTWKAKGYAITSNGTWCFHCRSENSGKTQRKKILHVETGNIFISLNEAARKTGLSAPNICAAIKGRRPHPKGFTFEYV